MYLSKIKIKNFRQFKEVEIDFNDEVNILAGSNNSGKTTILELLQIVFENKKFKIDDLNIEAREKLEKLTSNDNLSPGEESEYLETKIEVKIVVNYEDDDNLSVIGEYINELYEDHKSIYMMLVAEVDYHNTKLNDKLSLITRRYYTDSKFEILEKTENIAEKFNYKKIEAKRDVDDTNEDRGNILSRKIHNLLIEDTEWIEKIEEIKRNISNSAMDEENIENKLEKLFERKKEEVLKNLMDSFNKTNGGNVETLKTIFEVDEKNILKLIEKSILLKYDFGRIKLNENAQGLGYSNLLYILIEIFEFDQNIDDRKVNLLFIEEPESHLHPAMERNLIRYIEKETKNIQIILTSHSKEVVQCVKFENIKVLRSENRTTKVYDLNHYCTAYIDDCKFIKKFTHVVSDIFYADKVIMIEGDSERIYFETIIHENIEYSKLSEDYISYIQVGGRHALSYKSFLEFMNLKTLILSDMDYDPVNSKSVDKKVPELRKLSSDCIKDLESSNKTIENFVKTSKIIEINKKMSKRNYGKDKQIICFTQLEEDGYARSFEDAILFKLYGNKLNCENVLSPIKRKNWREFKKNNGIDNIADANEQVTHLLSRSLSITGSKTDFIYDLVKMDEIPVPEYIDRGFRWLMKE